MQTSGQGAEVRPVNRRGAQKRFRVKKVGEHPMFSSVYTVHAPMNMVRKHCVFPHLDARTVRSDVKTAPLPFGWTVWHFLPLFRGPLVCSDARPPRLIGCLIHYFRRALSVLAWRCSCSEQVRLVRRFCFALDVVALFNVLISLLQLLCRSLLSKT